MTFVPGPGQGWWWRHYHASRANQCPQCGTGPLTLSGWGVNGINHILLYVLAHTGAYPTHDRLPITHPLDWWQIARDVFLALNALAALLAYANGELGW